MITRASISDYLNDYLNCKAFQDYAPNGLQVEGRFNIKTICTAVSASLAVIEEAISRGADALLVHHGFFWRGEESVITGMRRQRIGALIKSDLNLFAYHLPLDCHQTLGNNACIGKLLQVDDIVTHDVGNVSNILWSGRFKKPLSKDELTLKLGKVFNRQPLQILGNEKDISHIAWCSGAAEDFIEQAASLGADAYISGEISERTYYQATELKINYYSCGHHATERCGILALGEHIANKFNISHHFIDSENPT